MIVVVTTQYLSFILDSRNSDAGCLDSEYSFEGLCIAGTEVISLWIVIIIYKFCKLSSILDILFIDALAFSRKDNSSCSGHAIQQFHLIHDAYKACKRDEKCIGIVDAGCDNFMFWTCEEKIESALNQTYKTSCAWERGKKQRFIHIFFDLLIN